MSNNKQCQFEPSTNTSSATICKWCGQEKWQHNTIMSNNKQSMKLYTEIQVIEAIDKASLPNMTIFDILEDLTPIELPSDEEIEQIASDYRSTSEFCDIENFEDGAVFSIKWLRNKIQGGNK